MLIRILALSLLLPLSQSLLAGNCASGCCSDPMAGMDRQLNLQQRNMEPKPKDAPVQEAPIDVRRLLLLRFSEAMINTNNLLTKGWNETKVLTLLKALTDSEFNAQKHTQRDYFTEQEAMDQLVLIQDIQSDDPVITPMLLMETLFFNRSILELVVECDRIGDASPDAVVRALSGVMIKAFLADASGAYTQAQRKSAFVAASGNELGCRKVKVKKKRGKG